MERVRLCVDLTTFYKQLTHYNFFPSSNPFNYFTQGVVCTEVEVDVLSGNHKTLRSDVVVDVGSSINPMIDIGQIEGAFTQGAGWSTIEETIYSCDDHTWVRPRGAMFTTGPGTYKIPVCADNSCVCFLIFFFCNSQAFNDVPEIFNVSLLPNADNPFAVHSSKAIGEPPFFLGASVCVKLCLHCMFSYNIFFLYS